MNTSPRIVELPKKNKVQKLMTFGEALQEAVKGNNITRIVWNDTNSYGLISNDKLMIHLRGMFHEWIVVTGDIIAEDWIIV